MTPLRNLPDDLNIELLLSYLPKGSYEVALKGLHKRNAYNDIAYMEQKGDGSLHFDIARDSLYNALPEYMFHPIDRFDNLPRLEEQERFAEELEKQEQEKEHAYRFFAPMDLQLLLYRKHVREELEVMTADDKILTDIIGDRLTEAQRTNRFIRQAIPFLPHCKTIRGRKDLLMILLRKIFLEEGLHVKVTEKETTMTDTLPQYADGLGAKLNDSYVGNVYDEDVLTYTIHYWPEEWVNDKFLQFIDDMEIFRDFLEDYFLAVEEKLHFDITHDDLPLRLSDDIVYNYLDYNTNI